MKRERKRREEDRKKKKGSQERYGTMDFCMEYYDFWYGTKYGCYV